MSWEKKDSQEEVSFNDGALISNQCYKLDAPLKYVEANPEAVISSADIIKMNGKKGKKFYVSKSYKDLLAKIKEIKISQTENTLYECMPVHKLRKFHFDLDFEPHEGLTKEKRQMYREIVTLLLEVICLELTKFDPTFTKKKNILVTSSHSETKLSNHIIVLGKCSEYVGCDNFYKTCVQKILEKNQGNEYQYVGTQNGTGLPANKDIRNIIDFNIYKSFQQLRYLGATKKGANRPKIIDTSFGTYDPYGPRTAKEIIVEKRELFNGKNYKRELTEQEEDQIFYDSLITYIEGCQHITHYENLNLPKHNTKLHSKPSSKGAEHPEGHQKSTPKKPLVLDDSDIQYLLETFEKSKYFDPEFGVVAEGDKLRIMMTNAKCRLHGRVHSTQNAYVSFANESKLPEEYKAYDLWKMNNPNSNEKYQHSVWLFCHGNCHGNCVEGCNHNGKLNGIGRLLIGPTLDGELIKNIEYQHYQQQTKSRNAEICKKYRESKKFNTDNWKGEIKNNTPPEVKDPSKKDTVESSNAKNSEFLHGKDLTQLSPDELNKLRYELKLAKYGLLDKSGSTTEIKWPGCCDVHNSNDRYLKPFPITQRILMCKSPMNSGKTVQVIDWLNNIIAKNPDYNIVILSARRSFTKDIQKRFEQSGLKFTSYMETAKAKYVIIQVESLHKDDKNDLRRNIVVVDECSAVLNQFNTNFHKNNIDINQRVFAEYIKDAQHCIFLDGDLNEHCVDMIHRFAPDDRIHLIHNHTRNRVDHNLFRYSKNDKDQEHHWFKELEDAFSKNKKVAIATTSKNFGQTLINTYGDRMGKYMYVNRDSSPSDLENLNETTKDLDTFLFTTTLSVGVDINNDNFDVMFVYVTSESACARDANQMIHRVRILKDKTIHLLLKQSHLGKSVYPDFLDPKKYLAWYKDFIVKEYNKEVDDILKKIQVPKLNFDKSYDENDVTKYKITYKENVWDINSLYYACETNRSKVNITCEIIPYLVNGGYKILQSPGLSNISVDDPVDLLIKAQVEFRKQEAEAKVEAEANPELPPKKVDMEEIYKNIDQEQQQKWADVTERITKSNRDGTKATNAQNKEQFVKAEILDSRSYNEAQTRIREDKATPADKINVEKTEKSIRFGVEEDIVNIIHDKPSLQNHIKHVAFIHRYDEFSLMQVDSYNRSIKDAHKLMLTKCQEIKRIISLLGLENIFDDQKEITYEFLESQPVIDYFNKENIIKLGKLFEFEILKDTIEEEGFRKLPVHEQHYILIHKIFMKFFGFSLKKPYQNKKKKCYFLKPFSNPLKESRKKNPTVKEKRVQ